MSAKRRQPINAVVVVQAVLSGIGLATALDTLRVAHAYTLDPVMTVGGAIAGGIGGLLFLRVVLHRFAASIPLQIWPVWSGALASGCFFGGIFANVTATLPTDYRPLVATTVLGTLPGMIGGWIVGRNFNHGMLAQRAQTAISAQLAQAVAALPDATGDIFAQDDGTYIARISFSQPHETLVFYFTCTAFFPTAPPTFVGIESELPGGNSEIAYEPPILTLWQPSFTLLAIINEALTILRR